MRQRHTSLQSLEDLHRLYYRAQSMSRRRLSTYKFFRRWHTQPTSFRRSTTQRSASLRLLALHRSVESKSRRDRQMYKLIRCR
jgi:hypothetical protein